MSDEIKKGGCLCGKIEYEFDSSKVISAHHCHCKDCQKSTGSGKATILLIPEEDLSLSGNLKFYTVTGPLVLISAEVSVKSAVHQSKVLLKKIQQSNLSKQEH